MRAVLAGGDAGEARCRTAVATYSTGTVGGGGAWRGISAWDRGAAAIPGGGGGAPAGTPPLACAGSGACETSGLKAILRLFKGLGNSTAAATCGRGGRPIPKKN